MSKDERNDDSELKAYLEGRDGVSAAYRKSGGEQPPAALDSLILRAAREAVREKPAPRRASMFGGSYAVAASFMVGVFVTSLYFSMDGLRSSAPSAVVVVQDDVAVPAPIQAEAEVVEAEVMSTNEAIVAADAQPPAANSTAAMTVEPPPRQILGPVPPAAVVAEAVRGIPAEPAVEAAPGEFTQRAAPPSRAVASAQALPRIAPASEQELARQEEAAEASRLERLVAEANRAVAAEEADELQEITVTGSRIREDDEPDTSYRESQEEWLQKIRDLEEEVDMLEARAAAGREVEILEVVRMSLEEERELFAEAYPDVDLDEALEQEPR